MSSFPTDKSPKNTVRWLITGCLGVLAVICIGSIISLKSSPTKGETGLESLFGIMGLFQALEVLALIGLGVWILRRPVPGAVNFLGRWAGKVLLFLGLGLATVIFLFATCWALVN